MPTDTLKTVQSALTKYNRKSKCRTIIIIIYYWLNTQYTNYNRHVNLFLFKKKYQFLPKLKLKKEGIFLFFIFLKKRIYYV